MDLTKFKDYKFSKSDCSKINEDIVFSTCIFKYPSQEFDIHYNNNNIILVIFDLSCIGIFLTKSEASLFQIILNHISYFKEENCTENKTCQIINLPNLIDPRFSEYILDLPKYTNIPIINWNTNIKNLVKEIDPFFKEENLIEEKELEKSDIYRCKICKAGFLMKENNSESCLFHPGDLKYFNDYPHIRYSCCGLDADQGIDIIGCRRGYHIPQD